MPMGDKQWEANARSAERDKERREKQQAANAVAHERTLRDLHNSPNNYYGPNGPHANERAVPKAPPEAVSQANVHLAVASPKKKGGLGTFLLVVIGVFVAIALAKGNRSKSEDSGAAPIRMARDTSSASATPPAVIDTSPNKPQTASELGQSRQAESIAVPAQQQSDLSSPASAAALSQEDNAQISSAQIMAFIQKYTNAEASNDTAEIATLYGPVVTPYNGRTSASREEIIEESKLMNERGVRLASFRLENVVLEGGTVGHLVRFVKVWSAVDNGAAPSRTPCLLTIELVDGALKITGEQTF